VLARRSRSAKCVGVGAAAATVWSPGSSGRTCEPLVTPGRLATILLLSPQNGPETGGAIKQGANDAFAPSLTANDGGLWSKVTIFWLNG
jgi:hypothetical protein